MTPADVKFIAVHCSATQASADIGRAEIDRWHRQKGWLMIGYHFVIRRDGTIERGRPIDMAGAHVEGHNHESIGICMVGGVKQVPDADGKDDPDGPQWDLEPENNFTEDQFQSLAQLVLELRNKGYGAATVQGHRDFPGVTKACPSFDVKSWLKENSL